MRYAGSANATRQSPTKEALACWTGVCASEEEVGSSTMVLNDAERTNAGQKEVFDCREHRISCGKVGRGMGRGIKTNRWQ